MEITLASGGFELGVMPELGASITKLHWNQVPVLRDTPQGAADERAFSSLPLIPFSNRIRHGEFGFGGRQYQLARDAEDPRHALHGTARFRRWEVAACGTSSVLCRYEHTPRQLDWPFAYQAWQRFSLAPDRLRVEIGLRNRHDAPAPFGIGMHPYFVRVPGTALRFDAGYVWAKDDEDIPVRAIADAGKFDFRHLHALDSGLIDNDYGGWGRVVEITAPQRPVITLQASAAFSQLVLFTPEAKPYFAAEPVSHRPDAINPNGDPHDHGMTILRPGETLEGVVEIIVAA